MYSSITPLRSFSSRGVWVWTFMPGATGVVQLAGVPLRAFDLDQAQPARAERGHVVGGAELGDVAADLGRRAHHAGAGGHGDLAPVDGQA